MKQKLEQKRRDKYMIVKGYRNQWEVKGDHSDKKWRT